MDMSFTNYRDTSHVSDDDEDSDYDVIEDSQNSEKFVESRKSSTKTLENIIVPGSDSDSDEDTSEDESMVFRPRKKNRVFNIESDTDSEVESSVPTYEPTPMSKTTRLSIYGVKPTDASSDESDFIQSDDEEKAVDSSTSAGSSKLEKSIKIDLTPDEHEWSDDDPELHPNPYVTTPVNVSRKLDRSVKAVPDCDLTISPVKNMDVSIIDDKNESLCEIMDISMVKDDEVEITQVSFKAPDKQEVISLSTDDEVIDLDILQPKEKRKSLESRRSQGKISSYVVKKDHTYPNSQLVYVSEQMYKNEQNKLDELRRDLKKSSELLEKMNLNTLPDKGVKLSMRCEEIKVQVKKQAEKLSNMVIEPDKITMEDLKKDGFISWDQLEKGSTAVQPRMHGTQALNTHMIQQTLTLERLKALHSSLGTRPSEDTVTDPPKALITTLMPHQLHALAWLIWRETQTPKGGILADDMGLGKTLTMISLILRSKENNLDDVKDTDDDDEWNSKSKAKMFTGGTLVVCPASLMNQWYGEIKKHCKKHSLYVEIHHGNKRESKGSKLARNDVVITTYNIIQRDLQKNGVMMNIRWRRVILDEAHVVRNYKSLTAQAIFKLSATSRWCLTGTPIHNKDLDLFSLLKFLRCSPFDDIVLWKKWIDNKSTGGQERLATVMKSLMLRRTKQQLQEQKSLISLPQKTSEIIKVALSKEEMKVYEKVLLFSKTLFAQFLHQRAEKHNMYETGGLNERSKKDQYFQMYDKMVSAKGVTMVKSHEILVLLLRLRQICCHPGLINAMLEDENDANRSCHENNNMSMLHEISKMNLDEIDDDADADKENQPSNNNEGVSVSTAIKQVLHISNPVFDLKRQSAKIDAIISCLKNNVFVKEGDKAIVVSQWTSMLDLVDENLKQNRIKTLTLSGKVPVKDRDEVVKKFNDPNSNYKILLLSLCAGGVGLNLVGGNHLLLADLHWNPQLEAQAQDRIYRVGQKKPVFIYKFVCQETVEQTILQLQEKKLTLASNVFSGVKMIQSSKLGIDDLKQLFNMRT